MLRLFRSSRVQRCLILVTALTGGLVVLVRDDAYFGDHQATADSARVEAPAPAFGVSDLSLLVPLQAAPKSQVSESVYGHTGTGFCNAPGLDLGGDDPVMSREQWQDWAKDTLLAVLPLPASDAVWEGKKPAAADLYREMRAIPDIDTTSDCPDPVAGDLLVQDVAALRQAGTNVATQQSLPRGICAYKQWRVVSARFDPCPFQAKVLADDPTALTPAAHPEFPAAACGAPELRLVVQPFIREGSRGYHAIDMAMHLFYAVPDMDAALTHLRAMQTATRLAFANDRGRQPATAILQPHPGLREEMDCGGHPLGDGDETALGPVGKAWRQLLSNHAKASRLFKVAWVLSDNSGGNWSFGLRVLQPALGKRVIKRLDPFKVETFSSADLRDGFPFSPFDTRLNTLNYFYPGERKLEELSSGPGQAALGELFDLANPRKTSFNLGGKLGASCASCHARDFAERSVRESTGLGAAQLAKLAGAAYQAQPLWEPFRAEIDSRNFNNFRHFGYGPAMTFGVSRRSINEGAELAALFNGYFAAGNPAAAPATPPADNPSASYPLAIQPILATRCGYCHGFKRAPDVQMEGVANALACRIDMLVQSGPLEDKHMPPGVALPPQEQEQIHAWAMSQSCAPTK